MRKTKLFFFILLETGRSINKQTTTTKTKTIGPVIN